MLRRLLRRALVPSVATALAAGGLLLAAPPAQALDGVSPTILCVDHDDTTAMAVFGYVNRNTVAVTIPVGATNYFSPLASNQGQPITFYPGIAEDAFSVTWGLGDAADIAWTLLGQTVSTADPAPRCTGAFTQQPQLLGLPTVGQRLDLDPGRFRSGLDPYAGPQTVWMRDCDTEHPATVGTGPTYTVQPEDAGHRIGASVTYTFDRPGPPAPDVTASTACGEDALAGAAPAAGAPQPRLTGGSTPGSVLEVEATWSGGDPVSRTVAWQRCDARACTAVPGTDSYPLTVADVGHQVRALVTASNPWGSVTVVTPAVVVQPAPGAAPAVAGRARVTGGRTPGSTLEALASWTGDQLTEAVRWERCGDDGCTSVGSTERYTLTSADVGQQVRAVLTATNPWGSASQVTPSVMVLALPAPPATSPTPAGEVTASAPGRALRGRVGRRGGVGVVRVVNGSSATVRLGAARLTGAQRRDFRLAGGTCARGGTLAAGASCTVRVQLRARAAGVRRAILGIPVTGRSGLAVALVGRARR